MKLKTMSRVAVINIGLVWVISAVVVHGSLSKSKRWFNSNMTRRVSRLNWKSI